MSQSTKNYTIAELQADLEYVMDTEELEQDLAEIIEDDEELHRKSRKEADKEAKAQNDHKIQETKKGPPLEKTKQPKKSKSRMLEAWRRRLRWAATTGKG